jgi:hypothetical protein
MTSKPQPSSALDAYRAIIDELAFETSVSVSASLLVNSGLYCKTPGGQAANEFVRSLNPEQRALLAKILHEERVSAIHDALAVLTWWVTCRDVALSFRGQEMSLELTSGEGLHGDYIGRCNGWQWPRGSESAEA